MALNDIYENFQDYQEINKLRVFLYTPSNQLVRELETINPVLRLKKTGFHAFDFGLPAKIFNLEDLSHSDNPLIDYTLDGYEVEVWVGDTTQVGAYDKYRFIIANRPSSMTEEKPVFNYSCISSEYELKKLPIINWPGIEVTAYKQTSGTYSSLTQSGTPLTSPPQLLDGTTGYAPIALTKTPKQGTITVTRAHTVYGVEEQLFPSTTIEPTDMNEDEYILYQSSGTWYIQAYVPGNIKLPVDNAGTIRWNDPVDQYKYYIYYETEDTVSAGDLGASFEESPYFKKDGLTINEVVADLFNNLQSSDSNMQHFLGWTYDSVNSDAIEAIRSGLAFDNTNLYDILQSLAENYQVYIDYNTLTRVVKIRNLDFGSNNGLRFEYGKYLRGVTQEINTDNQINYVQGQDSNGVGFADVSWSGDNYLEDYTYFLDGVTHNGASASGLPSRWLSNGLATELALRKYYQGIYNQEVWGNTSGTVKGIAQLRYDLQEQIAEKQFELEEINAKIEQTEGLIESYNNETDVELKQKLDATSRESSYLVPKILAANTTTELIDYSLTPANAGGYTIPDQTLTLSSSIYAKAFKLFGSPDTYFTYIDLIDTVQVPVETVYRSSIKVVFKNNGSIVTTKFMTFKQLNKELILDDIYLIDEIVVSGSLIVKGTYTTYSTISLDSIDVYQFESATPIEVVSWTDFVERQLYLKELEEIKRNEKQLEIDLLQTGPQLLESSFDETAVINESNSYGLYELEQRLAYIRGFTAINYNNLTTAEKTELKRIRRGSVYQNTDIVDSKNLFEASRTYLEENVNPAVTVTIDTISILQSYEAQSDWSKVQIGEKVDIYVPQLQINIEAEIQEINIDFQNYKMGLTISTVQNYDKSFGKYFSNVFKLLTTNVYNEQRPNESDVDGAVELNADYGAIIEEKSNGSSQTIGYNTNDNPQETSTSPNEINFNETFIDPRIDRLVSRPPSWPNGSGGTFNLYGDIAPGTATLTSGGLYIKDENDNLRVKLTARDGLVAEQFSIDLEGNATFSGTLAVGVDTTGLNGLYDASGAAAQALLDANSYTDGEITAVEATIATLQSQVDGAIDTYFGDGVPLPTTTTSSGTTLPVSGSEGDTFYDTDDNLYYTFTQGSWVVGGNSDIDSITAWPTNNVDFYDAHKGDLYYDNTTGYAYRFTKTGTEDPDVVGNYKWVQISDSAATAALAAASTAQATADGKVTIFSASSDATYGTLVDDNILDGDVFMPTANFTATGATHTSLNNDYDFIQNDTYVYIASTKTFTKLQDVENKTTGTVGGWTITSDQIKSNNDEIILDNTDSTITVGSGSGVVTLDGAATGTGAVLNHSKFQLKADGSASFSGGLSAATGTFAGELSAATGSFGSVTVDSNGSITLGNIVIDNDGIVATDGEDPATETFNLSSDGSLTITGGLSAATTVNFSNTNVSINQGTYGYDENGIFLGVKDVSGSLEERFSIKNSTSGNFLTWDGSALTLKGNLNVNKTYYKYEAARPTGSNYTISGIQYSGTSQATDFPFNITTGSSIVSSTNNYWIDLGPDYIGFSQPEDGSHTDTENNANNFIVGAVYYFTGDASYYEVGAGSTTTILLTMPTGSTPSTVNLALIQDGSLYRLSPSFVSFVKNSTTYSFTIASGWAANTAYTSKTITFTATAEEVLTDLLDTVLVGAGFVPAVTSINGQTGDVTITTGGSVTSVGLSLPNIFTVDTNSSPITTSGTLTATLTNQDANKVFAGPSTGSAAAPTFRALVAADIPSLNYVSSTTLRTKNTVLAGPTTGSDAAPTFRSLVAADIPALTTYLAVAGDTMEGDLTMKTTNNLAASGSQSIIFQGYQTSVVPAGTFEKSLVMNSSGDLTFGGTAVSLSTHSHTSFAALELSDDLTLQKDGSTTVGSHGVKFNYHNGTGDLSKELNVTSAGTLTFGGTTVSLTGHTHSDYVAVAGDTMTGDLTLDQDGDDTANRNSHGINFITYLDLSDATTTTKLYVEPLFNRLKFGLNTIEFTGHTHATNTKTAAGFVSAPGAVANKVWKTDANGNPDWRDDADNNTWQANTKTQEGYVSAPGAVANQVWKTDANGNPGWRSDSATDSTKLPLTGGTLTGDLTLDHDTTLTASPSKSIFFTGRTGGVDFSRELQMDQTGTLNFNGTAVSLSGHTHTFDSLTSKPTTLSGYGITDAEPAFTKNTGFNKNFGTTSGTVSEGDHTHSQYLLDTGDTLSGQLLMNAVSPTGTTSDSQQILFRGRALGGNVDRALKINSLGTLLFNGTEVSLSGHTHSYLPLSGGTVTGDLTLERDGSTSVGSHGIVFQYNNGSSTLTRELNVNSVGTLNFNGTAVSLSGHTHSYLPLSGGTLTGDLTMQPVGPTASSSESESIVFVSRAINTDISTAIYTNSAGNLTVGGTEVSLSGHNHSASNITSGTLTVARGGTGASTLTSGEVLIGAGTAAVTTLSRSGIDSRTEFPPSSHEHSGSDITSGTVDGARLPTNTVIGTTFSGAWTLNTGTMIYRDVYGWHSLGIGGTGEVLVSDGTRPSWGDLPAHAHGNLSSTGVISTNTAPASGQHLVITSSGNALQQSSITFGTSTTTFLRNDGTWQTGTGAVQSVNGYTGVVSTEVLTTSTSTVNSVTYGRTYGIAVRDSVATRMRISTGVINPTGTSSNSISFGTTFSNVPVVTVFQLKAASTTDTIVSAKATAVTTTGATITMSFANASTDGYTPSGQTYGWIAIGV